VPAKIGILAIKAPSIIVIKTRFIQVSSQWFTM